MMRDLPAGEQRVIQGSLDDLKSEFHGIFDDETIEHFVVDSYERLAATAKVKTFVSVMSERFARQRLQAMAHIETTESGTPSVLFLCVHNAGRSQMAAGWLRSMAGDRVNVYTGGSEPGAELNPMVVDVMAEVGIDVKEEFPKPWTDEIVRAAEYVIAMGCGDVCPIYPGKRYVDWDLEDPAGKEIGAVRDIRDEIRRRVEELVTTLGIASTVE
jgi:protein-tyrosine-phosphatase